MISDDQTQQTDSFASTRRHLQYAMTLRVQRTFQVADVRVLFGVHLVVGENEFHRIDEEPHLASDSDLGGGGSGGGGMLLDQRETSGRRQGRVGRGTREVREERGERFSSAKSQSMKRVSVVCLGSLVYRLWF